MDVDHIRAKTAEFTQYSFGPLGLFASNQSMRKTFEQIVLPLHRPPKTAVESGFSSAFGKEHQEIYTQISGDTAIHRAEVLDWMRNDDCNASA